MSLQRAYEPSEHGKRRNSGQSDCNNALSPLRKRKCLDNEDINDCPVTSGPREVDYRTTRPKKKLLHANYTIAWICALPLELKAAICMLDEEHETLPVAPSDENVYVLGSIAGHNVVMTSLRAGVYGLVSATAVGKDILATFPNVKSTPLLVGVGGGCPSLSHDIRLGDVVVSKPTSESPAIRQYDSGKTVYNGRFEIKGSNNKPAPVLLNAVANLEARHDSLGKRIQNHITNAHQKDGSIDTHPGTDLDILFEPECEHLTNNAVCEMCGPLKPVSRSPRTSLCPEVHFGPIASGNQVMKDSITRSRLASEHGFLCFEMEAAGLMDFLPCLVIRGICDYCDSSKHKQFQPYAALTASAFAKELISVLPRKTTMEEQPDNPTAHRLERRKLIMEALDFVEADSRRVTIKKAYDQTCRWLFEKAEYINWRDHWKVDGKVNTDNALLWLKGKPGTGKSTIMKFILEDIEKRKSKNDVVVSFFFNARGEPLERTIEGLYRSLVVQLLSQLPDLQWLLEKITTTDSRGNIVLDRIIELFRSILQAINGKQVICLVDALDECSEQEIRDMLDEFVAVLEHSETEPNFRVLLSSRHYPHISIDVGQSFTLENQDGHANDLTRYINAELKIGKTKQAVKLKEEVLAKAKGIFLWLALVINILKREYDRGRIHDMARRLKEIPIELNQLFKEILLRDNNNVKELVLCIQWCLYSERPLHREEFYFAMLAGNNNVPIEAWDQEEATADIMDNFMLDSSKGLAEMTRGKKPVVQFIHESVREFFLAPDTLSSLSSDFQDVTQAGAQEKLRDCCYRLLSSEALDFMDSPEKPIWPHDTATWESLRSLSRGFPFLDYAASFVLCHVNKAEQTGKDQSKFLRGFCILRWTRSYNIVQKYATRRLIQEPRDVLLYLIYQRLQPLIPVWLDVYPMTGLDLHLLLYNCAVVKGDDTVKWFLLNHGQKLLSQTGDLDLARFDIFIELLLDGHLLIRQKSTMSELQAFAVDHLPQWMWVSAVVQEVDHDDTKKLIEFAAVMKRSKALELLLNAAYPLHQQLEPEFAQALLDRVFRKAGRRCQSLDVSKPERRNLSKSGSVSSMTDMLACLDADTKSCIEILIGRGAQIERIRRPGDIVHWAGLDTLRFLLQQDSLWVMKSFVANNLLRGGNILHEAIFSERAPIYIELLIHHGAEISAQDTEGDTPLIACARYHPRSKLENAQVLVNHGAQTDWIDEAMVKYPWLLQHLTKIKTMIPQTPCCSLGNQTDTVLQSSDGGILEPLSAGRLEHSLNDRATGDETSETADTPIFNLDDWMSFENYPEIDNPLLQSPGDYDDSAFADLLANDNWLVN